MTETCTRGARRGKTGGYEVYVLLVAVVLAVVLLCRLGLGVVLAALVLLELGLIPLLVLGGLLHVGSLLVVREGLPLVRHESGQVAEVQRWVFL